MCTKDPATLRNVEGYASKLHFYPADSETEQDQFPWFQGNKNAVTWNRQKSVNVWNYYFFSFCKKYKFNSICVGSFDEESSEDLFLKNEDIKEGSYVVRFCKLQQQFILSGSMPIL